MRNIKYTDSLTLVFALVVWISGSANAEDSVEQLEERSEFCAESPEGANYGVEALQAFWGDVSFMLDCAPPGTEGLEDLTIYLKVNSDGSLNQVEIDPANEISECIKQNVKNRTLPKPPFGNYVFQVSVSLDL